MAYVYIIENKINGKKYIGFCKDDDSIKYMGSGVRLKAAFEKYGKDNFTKEILKYFDTESEARYYEEKIISECNAVDDPNYYNLTKGGYGGFGEEARRKSRSKESIEKRSKKRTGQKLTEKQIRKMSERLKGYKWTQKQIEDRREGLKRYWENVDPKEIKERNKKISDSKKGNKVSNTVKEKISKKLSKLTDEEALKVKKMINDKISYRVIAKTFNISVGQITSIKQEKTYKWLWN